VPLPARSLSSGAVLLEHNRTPSPCLKKSLGAAESDRTAFLHYMFTCYRTSLYKLFSRSTSFAGSALQVIKRAGGFDAGHVSVTTSYPCQPPHAVGHPDTLCVIETRVRSQPGRLERYPSHPRCPRGISGGTAVAPSSPDHLNSSSRFVRVKGPHTAIAVRCSDGGRLQARTLEFVLPRYRFRSLGDFASIE
jgi:hypothetical protein